MPLFRYLFEEQFFIETYSYFYQEENDLRDCEERPDASIDSAAHAPPAVFLFVTFLFLPFVSFILPPKLHPCRLKDTA